MLLPSTEADVPHIFKAKSHRQMQPITPASIQLSMEMPVLTCKSAAENVCCQQMSKDISDMKETLLAMTASFKKRAAYISKEIVELNDNMQQGQATLANIASTLERHRATAHVQSSLNFPLCTAKAYDNIVCRLSKEKRLADEAVKHLAVVGGRSEADFIRNILKILLGPPLCQTFCWAGGVKRQELICCLFFVSYPQRFHARNGQYRDCNIVVVRQTAINWFHGSSDRYGGRSKRRRDINKITSITTDNSACRNYPRPRNQYNRWQVEVNYLLQFRNDKDSDIALYNFSIASTQ